MTQLYRAHGLGNDYLVWEGEPGLTMSQVIQICHRHTGVGGDGVLEPWASDRADHGVTIWNPDGSIAEKSGNGLRIFARWLVDCRGAPPRFTVDTGHDVVLCEVSPEQIAVQMGTARIGGRRTLAPLGRAMTGWVVDVGNPHFVVFGDSAFAHVPWRDWGAALEVDPSFANRSNVQFARLEAGRLEIRIWERGAGETSASGSSSCAVAAAAVFSGRLEPGEVAVHMPGGTLMVHVGADLDLRLEGPVQVVGRITLDSRWWADRVL